MKEKKPASKYTLRGQLFVLAGTILLLCTAVILLFLPLLNRTLEGLMDRSTQALQRTKEVDASTIARLFALELARFKDLPEAVPGLDRAVDQDIKNLLWEKVSFNAIIQGIELIHSQENPGGEHLTYLFYRIETPKLNPMLGPQKVMKKFTGLEEDLINGINKRQVVDKNLLESVNRGPKPEGEMLFRYMPIHVLTPDEGAVYWGVAKIGLSTRSIRQAMSDQVKEQERVYRSIMAEILLSLTLSALLAMTLIYFWVRSLTEPLKKLGIVAASFKTASSREFDLWLNNLKRVDPKGLSEVADIQEVLQRLGTAVPRLGQRLIAGESQACLGRVWARILPVFEGWRARLLTLLSDAETPGGSPARREVLEILEKMQAAFTALQLFEADRAGDWQSFDLAPVLEGTWRLVSLGLAPEVARPPAIGPLPPIYGSPVELAQAFLEILDFLAGKVCPLAEMSLQARSSGARRVQITWEAAGPEFSEAQCGYWLDPLQDDREMQDELGPGLAAAIASQHGGSLALAPRGHGGLIFRLELPAAGGGS